MTTPPPSAADLARRAWAGVVDVDTFDPADDFFALGGDSVSAALVARKVGVAANVDIPPRTLFEHPTFGAFTAFVEARRAAPVVLPRPDPSMHPMAPGQERLWLLHQLHPDRATYTVGTVVEMVGPLDRVALSSALEALVARHEPLRTVVRDEGGAAECRVTGPGPVAVEPASATGVEHARQLAAEFLARPLPLAEGWPVRVQLVRLDPARHWLVLAIHHFATDGESERILLDELGRLYTAAATGAATPLAPLVAAYGDVAAWRAAQPGVSPARLDRRRDELAGQVDRPLALEGCASDRAAGVGARHRRWLGRPLADAVRACAGGLRTTVFITLLSAFTDIVARWSGSDDVCVGYPVSVREPAPARHLVGFFVDTCVVRLDLSERPTFRSVITRTHAAVVEAAAEPVAFDALAEAVAAARGDRRPLFRAWFNHLGGTPRPPAMHRLFTRVLDLPVPPALFDLNVYIVEDGGDIRVDVVRDVAMCSAEAAEELLDQYVALLAQAAGAVERPLRSHRVDTVRSTRLPDPADRLVSPPPPSLLRQLSAIVARRGSAVAVRDADGEVTYARLRGAVRDLVAVLRDAGVRAGDTVAVLARRDAGLVTSMLATWAAGGRLLLLDPGYPAARLATYVDATRPRCLVTGPEQAADLGVAGLVVLDRVTARVVRAAGPDAVGGSGPPGGYVAFTSGTTGEPVAVTGTLGPIEHFLTWYAAENDLAAGDRFALLAGVSHDPVFRDVLLPLYSGATLSIPPPDVFRVPRDLVRWMRHHEITVANLTPPLARLLGAEGVCLPALRLVCLGGEAVTAADVDLLTTLAPRAVLLNGYGTTETPQLVSRRRMSPAEPPSLGAQVPGSQLLVVDADGQRCGIGEAGRIVARSRHLATSLTGGHGERGRVLEDPVPGVGRFATGDLGRYRTDGSVEYLGRDDDIVNVRGFRAHPAETDRALAGDPRIVASVTVPWTGPDGAELVSYVVGADLVPADIRARLATLLPAFLIPTAVVPVSRLPLTANGKVDRAALPPPRPGRPVTHVTTGAGGPLENRLAGLLSGILGIDATSGVDVDASLFELGATSLHLLRLHSAIRRDIDIRLPLLALYESPSIRALARRLSDRTTVPAAAAGPAGDRRGSRADERARRLAARQRLPESAGEARR